MTILLAFVRAAIPGILTGGLVLLLGGPWWAAVGFGIVVAEIRAGTQVLP